MLMDVLGERAVACEAPPKNAAAVVDASHPCERVLHQQVAHICAERGLPLLRLRRPGWQAEPLDRWQRVRDAMDARTALDAAWKRVFLCLGAEDRGPFGGDAARWYLVRSRRDDAADEGLIHVEMTTKAGPYTAEAEAALMRERAIDVLITRDAGGTGAWPKMAGARLLGLPVILIDRPAVSCAEVCSVEEALAWVGRL